jgi:hypothetical protein
VKLKMVITIKTYFQKTQFQEEISNHFKGT